MEINLDLLALKRVLTRIVETSPEMIQLMPQSKHFWLTFHMITLTSVIMYVASLVAPRMLLFTIERWYVYCLYGCIATYTLVLVKFYLLETLLDEDSHNEVAENGRPVLLAEILKSENFHLLLCSVLWIFTKPSIIKVLPYGIYSLLNISGFLTVDAFPDNQLSLAVQPLRSCLDPILLLGAAHSELLIFACLARESWEGESVFYFYLYMLLWGLKLEYSEVSRTSFHQVVDAGDLVLFHRFSPRVARQAWIGFKRTLYMLIPLDMQYELEDEDQTAVSSPLKDTSGYDKT